ncbi:hypothetical protein IAE37_001273 [Pseudomonas sp. S31]|uniref:hypothetical protein n=1 Tax=Pseudomonas sp. S31 TaxID=1564473 RepID=UPI0019115DEA|nr:hypothetical protein [Pseudomonas sp. S31]MBK4998997.1 hypothetical protein [Pseudomonas sp. S31]
MIIASSHYLAGYAHRTLPFAFVRAMERHAEKNKISPIGPSLKLFECFCDIAKIKFNYTTLSRKKVFTKIVNCFVGAILSDNFVKGSPDTKRRWIKRFIDCLSYLRAEVPGMPVISLDTADSERCKLEWENLSGKNFEHLDQHAVHYWKGWPIVALTGAPAYLKLSMLWHSHGPKFTEDLYQAWNAFVGKNAKPSTTEINRFCEFLAKNSDAWPISTFKNPLELKQLFLSYMREFFTSGSTQGSQKKQKNQEAKSAQTQHSIIMSWNIFISNVETAFIAPGLWARPFTPLPRIQKRDQIGALKHKIKVNDQGIEVQNQLITEIPLHITDNEAVELIFHKVEYDISVVQSWALTQSKSLYERASRRKDLAKIGKPYTPGQPKRPSKQNTPLEDHCATFEAYGLPANLSEFRRQYGEKSIQTTMAYDLGIPTAGTLFAHQCLLVSAHPKITHHSILNLELYNPNGVVSGFLPTDTGYQLTCYKDRRGAKLSEIKIDLTEESARWVKEVIEITQPLRDKLRKENDDSWRYLFLSCSDAFSSPGKTNKAWTPNSLKKHPNLRARIEQQFEPHTPLRGEELVNYISRVSLARLRASCGVAVYLKTRDVKEMAKALGHAKHSAQLLAHYLPQSLLAFFQSRWVRIFQKGFIVLAMKDSPYLLKATSFTSMAELDVFLKNHTIKEIPEHLEDPERTGTQRPDIAHNQGQIHIGIGAGSLAALLSLELAVKQALRPRDVCGKAKYWAEFASVLTAEIERDNDGVLHEHLASARQQCDAARMEELIYDAA